MKKELIHTFSVFIAALLFLQGCATYRGLKGFKATDLSTLHISRLVMPGMDQ